MNKTTIIVTKQTREKLKALGRKGESYDQIINRLIRLSFRVSEDVENGKEVYEV